ncbi:unnamed protein product [Linum trigynum]|uniref:Uncharacterized protein n=1 Tax=Linum trigynum TaxID=586398 RepID=A0AAV2DY30_9ROSI
MGRDEASEQPLGDKTPAAWIFSTMDLLGPGRITTLIDKDGRTWMQRQPELEWALLGADIGAALSNETQKKTQQGVTGRMTEPANKSDWSE